MAALIDMTNNRANIAYTGATPWHGLGQKIEGNDIDQWRIAAGLDWTANRSPVYFKHGDQMIQGTSEVIYRSDTGTQLGVVTDRYKIVQPAEVLEFFRDIVATQQWGMDVVGALDDGKRIWGLAKTEHEFMVNKSVDKVGMYLLLATSYDGKMSTIGKFTSVRVVCQNTLTASLNDSVASVKVGHNAKFDADAVKRELGIIDSVTDQFAEEATRLAQRKIKQNEAMRFIIDVLAGEGTDPETMSTRQSNIVKNVYDLYNGRGLGATLPSANGTAWGLLNAITQHVDHNVGRTTNNRIRSAWFGQGENLKIAAKAKALELAA